MLFYSLAPLPTCAAFRLMTPASHIGTATQAGQCSQFDAAGGLPVPR
jgi:hypothetical protein